jgi:hypothetical protein
MKSVLTNEFKKTYNKRDVDARLRVLYEKRTSLQRTDPANYLIIDIIPVKAGQDYKIDDTVLIEVIKNNTQYTIEVFVEEININGGIKKIRWDSQKIYDFNPENERIDDVETDINGNVINVEEAFADVEDPMVPWKIILGSNDGDGKFAEVVVISRYAPGKVAAYGDLGRATIDDPLVQESRLVGYTQEQLKNISALHFVGYICDVPPVPYGTIVSDADSYTVVQLKEGDLWLKETWKPDNPSIGVTTPETGAPHEEFPIYWLFGTSGSIQRWNGVAWSYTIPQMDKYYGKQYYEPEKLDLWSNLNVIKFDYDNSDTTISKPNNLIQNTGFYWFNGWRLFNFSVDEDSFVHKDVDEIITGWKTYTIHPDVPYTSKQLNWITSINPLDHTNHDDPSIGSGNHYATRAQVINSTLLKSGEHDGAKQLINGTTTFSGDFYIGPWAAEDLSDPQLNDSEFYSLSIDKVDALPVTTRNESDGETLFIVSEKTKTNFKNSVVISDINETNSISPRTGALVIYGGIGVKKDMYIGGNISVIGNFILSSEVNATYLYSQPPYAIVQEQNGALIVKGGADIAKRLIIRDDTDSHANYVNGLIYSYQTGALIVEGGIGIGKSINSHGPVIIDVYANTKEDNQVSNPSLKDDRYYKNYNTGLRINGPGAIIALGGSIESVDDTNSNQWNIISIKATPLVTQGGVGTGFNKVAEKDITSQIFFPVDNSNPIINGTKIPNLVFKNNEGDIESIGGAGYWGSSSLLYYSAQENNGGTNPTVPSNPTRIMGYKDTFYVPSIKLNNRGMITDMATTAITLPHEAEQNYVGFVQLSSVIPPAPSNYTGSIGAKALANPPYHTEDYYAAVVSLSTHQHPAGLARYSNQLQSFTGTNFNSGTGGYGIKAVRSTSLTYPSSLDGTGATSYSEYGTRLYAATLDDTGSLGSKGIDQTINSVFVYHADRATMDNAGDVIGDTYLNKVISPATAQTVSGKVIFSSRIDFNSDVYVTGSGKKLYVNTPTF